MGAHRCKRWRTPAASLGRRAGKMEGGKTPPPAVVLALVCGCALLMSLCGDIPSDLGDDPNLRRTEGQLRAELMQELGARGSQDTMDVQVPPPSVRAVSKKAKLQKAKHDQVKAKKKARKETKGAKVHKEIKKEEKKIKIKMPPTKAQEAKHIKDAVKNAPKGDSKHTSKHRFKGKKATKMPKPPRKEKSPKQDAMTHSIGQLLPNDPEATAEDADGSVTRLPVSETKEHTSSKPKVKPFWKRKGKFSRWERHEEWVPGDGHPNAVNAPMHVMEVPETTGLKDGVVTGDTGIKAEALVQGEEFSPRPLLLQVAKAKKALKRIKAKKAAKKAAKAKKPAKKAAKKPKKAKKVKKVKHAVKPKVNWKFTHRKSPKKWPHAAGHDVAQADKLATAALNRKVEKHARKAAHHAGKARGHRRFANLCKKYGLHSCHKRHARLAAKHTRLSKGHLRAKLAAAKAKSRMLRHKVRHARRKLARTKNPYHPKRFMGHSVRHNCVGDKGCDVKSGTKAGDGHRVRKILRKRAVKNHEKQKHLSKKYYHQLAKERILKSDVKANHKFHQMDRKVRDSRAKERRNKANAKIAKHKAELRGAKIGGRIANHYIKKKKLHVQKTLSNKISGPLNKKLAKHNDEDGRRLAEAHMMKHPRVGSKAAGDPAWNARERGQKKAKHMVKSAANKFEDSYLLALLQQNSKP